MLPRLVAAFLLFCLAASAETMSVDKLISFIESSAQFIREGKMTDKELASFLTKTTLTDKLEDRTVEKLQALGGIGPRTLEALRKLSEQSKTLAVTPQPEPPRQAPPPSSLEQGAIMNKVREYALNYSRQLPDFICTEVTRRYVARTPGSRRGESRDSEPSWQMADVVTTRLSFFEQKEDYKVILVNNTPTTADYQAIGGATVSGDFGTMMKDIFDRGTQARFEWERWATLRGRPTMVFNYKVDKSRSQWHVVFERSLDTVTGYHGLVYVDNETHKVMRITMEAELPADFPIRASQVVLDYDYQDLSGRKFLLPLRSRFIIAASDYMSRNDTEFRIYRKYSAESEIRFDTETPPPLPEDQTTETPAPPLERK